MSLQITNSLGRKKETFQPSTPNEVRMYVCGPTVYNFIHIGNARPLVFFDVVRRFLEFRGYKVTHVMNYTDVDDKIIERAKTEQRDWTAVVEQYIHEYETDMKLLGVRRPNEMPRVSENIPGIIQLIEKLVANGTAYVAADGEVFYSVRKFPEYGKLSGKNVDDLLSGARVEVDQKKKDPLDFSLWKPRKVETEPSWDSPWGKGRPGWHIECSVLAMITLGETFDIHGGGMDLIHPHHENEIAQSEAVTKKTFSRFWMHNNMLNMNAEKMSKSLGNIILTRAFIEKNSAEVLKYMLLSGHYRSVIDFSDQNLRDTQSALHRYYSAIRKCQALIATPFAPETPQGAGEQAAVAHGEKFQSLWIEAMEDDFNTARVMGLVFEYVRLINGMTDRKGFKLNVVSHKACEWFLKNMKELSSILNILGEDCDSFLLDLRTRVLAERQLEESAIQGLITQRIEARKNKDFKTADDIRKKLSELGIEIRDSADKTEWDVIFTATTLPGV